MSGRDWRPWVPGRAGRLDGLDPVIGHRGAAARAPENTLASLRKAKELGCRWVEFDVKLSRDGVPFLLHDDLLDRTTSGRGPASDHDFAELATLDAGGWFGPEFRGERLASLAQALELVLELGMEANLEIKPCPGRAVETARTICRALKELWPRDRPPPLLSSFELASLRAARDAAPELPRALLVTSLPLRWRELMAELACVSLNLSHRRTSDITVRGLAAEGVPLLFYTVNDAARATRLFELGAAAVFSDAPDQIRPPPIQG